MRVSDCVLVLWVSFGQLAGQPKSHRRHRQENWGTNECTSTSQTTQSR